MPGTYTWDVVLMVASIMMYLINSRRRLLETLLNILQFGLSTVSAVKFIEIIVVLVVLVSLVRSFGDYKRSMR